jgi:uncharacterized membrane protein
MKAVREFVVNTVVGGVLILLPVYLAVLLLLKAMKSFVVLLQPIAKLLPDWLPGENLLALLLVLVVCFVLGALVRTRLGRRVRERVEETFFGNLPGYDTIRSLSRRLAGQGDQNEWKPAFAEIEDALVPAFIVEEHADGRLTVFVPSIPTPFAGAVYILDRGRVHSVDVPFAHAVRCISRWGSGSKDLMAKMQKDGMAS